MRLGIVRGSIVLSQAVPSLRGTRMVIVEPVTAGNLELNNGLGGGSWRDARRRIRFRRRTFQWMLTAR